jgi:hypothetical protein
VASTNLYPLMQKGLDKNIFVSMTQRVPGFTKIFSTLPTSMRYIDMQMWAGYGFAQQRIPNGTFAGGAFSPAYNKHFVIRNFGLSDSFAIEDIDDDQYGVINRVIPGRGSMFARAFSDTMENDTSNFFISYGFSNSIPQGLMSDNLSLFNTAHPNNPQAGSGTFANRPVTDVDFSVAAYQAMSVNIRTQKYPNAVSYMSNRPRIIVCHPTIGYVVDQVLHSRMEPFTADRNENFGVTSEKVEKVEWEWFAKSGATGFNNAWFAVGQDHGLVFALRQSFRVRRMVDEKTASVLFFGSMRFDEGDCYQGRGVYGSLGN